MPRVDVESRRVRDALIVRLFLTGWSYRQIARHPKVALSHRCVGDVVQRALTAEPGRGAIDQQARQIYVMRLEQLLRLNWDKAMSGDIAAVDSCRRVLELEAKVFGLVET